MRHIALNFLSVCLLVALVSFPTQAQDREGRTGSRFKEDRYSGQEDRARLALNRFGDCVARLKSEEFLAFVQEPSAETWKKVMYFPNGQTRCADVNMKADSRTIQGSIAEGWYTSTYPDGLPTALKNYEPSLPPQGPAIERIMAADEVSKPYVIVNEFAACVVSAAPAEADRFVRTHVTSKDEEEAFQDLGPMLSPCAFDGQKLSFNMMGFRGAIAYALTELALNPNLHSTDES